MSSTDLAPDRIRKGERTRTRILDAAADVLARRGYAAATLTEIASVAKMQAGSLYYHFGLERQKVIPVWPLAHLFSPLLITGVMMPVIR